MSTGKVYLIGAGPGDPGLITVKGASCLQRADVVIYDFLASRKLLTHARKDAEIIYVGKRGGAHTCSQAQINELIVEKAKAGLTVARLKGGDPFIFGRGGEEAEVVRLLVSLRMQGFLLPTVDIRLRSRLLQVTRILQKKIPTSTGKRFQPA